MTYDEMTPEQQAQIDAEEDAREARKRALRREPAAVDTRSALEKALDEDDSEDYEVPGQRLRARRYGKAVEGDAPSDNGWERLLHCGCSYCNGRTWKRFRRAQYRTVKVG